MADLTAAMGITKPSLYAAFGNKEALFHKALDLYEAEKLAYVRVALEQPTARDVAAYLLRGAADAQTNSCGPKGCLGVISSVACGAEAESIRADVIARRASSVGGTDRAIRTGETRRRSARPCRDPWLTAYLFAIVQGMAVQAGSALRAPISNG